MFPVFADFLSTVKGERCEGAVRASVYCNIYLLVKMEEVRRGVVRRT
jgi:hypothetical protein